MQDNKNLVRLLFLGDVVGDTGKAMVQKHVPKIRTEYNLDAVIVNGENSAQGKGITPADMKLYKSVGVNVVTTGNHIWQKREIYTYLQENSDLLRPANFPTGTPGKGYTTFIVNGVEIAIINLQGRVFMKELVSCPFRAAESLLTLLKPKTNLIFVDFHAETTAEKLALAYFLDGKVSGFVGTHTHVQTADERILPLGTGYITDLGMAGSLNSMIGMKKEPIIEHFLTQMPTKFVVDDSLPVVMSGVLMHVNVSTGKTERIERIRVIDNELQLGA